MFQRVPDMLSFQTACRVHPIGPSASGRDIGFFNISHVMQTCCLLEQDDVGRRADGWRPSLMRLKVYRLCLSVMTHVEDFSLC